MSSGSWAALDGCHSVGGPRCLSYPELVVPQSPLPCSEMGHAFRDSLSSHMSHCISRRKDISCGVPVQTFFFFFKAHSPGWPRTPPHIHQAGLRLRDPPASASDTTPSSVSAWKTTGKVFPTGSFFCSLLGEAPGAFPIILWLSPPSPGFPTHQASLHRAEEMIEGEGWYLCLGFVQRSQGKEAMNL